MSQAGAVKLARLLRMVGFALLLWTGLWMAWWLQVGMPLVAFVGALCILGVHVPVLTLEFMLLRWANRHDPAPRATALELMRALADEVLIVWAVFGWRQPYRSLAHADHLPAQADGRRGVILVHGFVCNRGLWNPWRPRLLERGVPCIAINLEPVFGSIDHYPGLVESAVQRMTEVTGQAPLLVAHSMGGLAVRAWMRDFDGDARVHGVVTLGSPHHGTWLGRFGYSPNARQMRLDGPWIRALAASESPQRYANFTCFYSHCDNIVFPSSTATLPGADNRHLHATAHVQLVQHPAVFGEVLRRLQA
jgi:triacylglycerol lipase